MYSGKNKNKIIPYLLGLLCCQNVIYLFKINNTYINIVQVFSFILVVYYFVLNKAVLISAIRKTNKYLKVFYFLIFVSIVQSGFLIASKFENISLSVYFTGLISYFLAYCYYLCIICNKENVHVIIDGLKTGFIINILIAIIQYIQFNKGAYFSLYKVFPQNAYIVSIIWENRLIAPASATLTYLYKASGLFLESSHYIVYYGISLLIILNYQKKIKPIFIVLLITSVLLLIGSLSGTSVILVLEFIMFFVLKFLYKGGKIKKKKFLRALGIVGISIIALSLLGSTGKMDGLFDYIDETVKTSNIFDESNEIRFSYMSNTIKTFNMYPLGIGINMAPAVLKSLWGSVATFNYLYTILLELGIIGLIVYLLLFVDNVLWLKRNIKNTYDIALLVTCFTILILQFSNGIYFINPYVILPLALIQIRRIEGDELMNE